MGKSEFQCDPSPKCWGLRVVAENGCPSDLTITLKLADGTGASLGSVLDTAGVVQVGQEAVMVFEVEAPTAQKAEIESVACT
jgi:hypothetical protein